jgi:VanZ family protein
VWALIAVVRLRRHGIRAVLERSGPEALVALSLAGIWAFTVAPWARFLPDNIPQHMPVNLVPVLPLLAGFTAAEDWRMNLPNLIANPVLYAPLGLGLSWRFGLRVRWVVLIAACLSAGVEVSQALSDQLRTPDINDVLLNATGAALGAWAFQLARRAKRAGSRTT